ncbi:hypothetical protein VTN77DRAFT_3421 [Rasamsonia byssochlamydoides]|uniref:uncharacterized protein n=1 Tax=Rasamsonia byssochlamydoides TaxID=89139 RepID=UPI0037445862
MAPRTILGCLPSPIEERHGVKDFRTPAGEWGKTPWKSPAKMPALCSAGHLVRSQVGDIAIVQSGTRR